MSPIRLARLLLIESADIVAFNKDGPEGHEVTRFLNRAGTEAGAVFGALTAITNEALRMMTDEQRAQFWRKFDTIAGE